MSDSVQDKVMNAIREGKVRMRPRWHFVALSTLLALSILVLGFIIVSTIGFFVFLLRESGAWFAPSFGLRGWIVLFLSIPWGAVALFAVLIALLEYLARCYKLVYRRPLFLSAVVLVLFSFVGGILIEPLHHRIGRFARDDMLPPVLNGMYQPPFHLHDPSVERGVIIAGDARIFVMLTDDGTTTVRVSPHTRLPRGSDFAVGDTVIVMGDRSATGTIEAFGIRELDPGERD